MLLLIIDKSLFVFDPVGYASIKSETFPLKIILSPGLARKANCEDFAG
jgi:hypothetical protein